MQADDQSSQSPSHSLSFDHDTPQRQSATSSNHYNTYNIQTLPNMQSRNKMYSTDFCSTTKPCKIQPRSNKKQLLNVDDKSLTSLPCSYQYNTLINNELPSTSNSNFTNNKYPHSVLELVGDGKDSKMDNSVILNNAKKSNNDNVNSVEMSSSEGVRKKYKRNSFLSTADDNYDKNYSKFEKKLNVSNTTEKYLCDIDILNAECPQVSIKEDKKSRAERKCNKNIIIDVSALKCKTTYFDNTDNVISYISDKEFERAKLAYLSNLDKLAKDHSITSGSDTLKNAVRADKKNVKSSKSNVTELLAARNINNYELLDSSQYPDPKYDIPKSSNVPSEYVDMGKLFKEKKYFTKDVHPEKDLNDANRVTNVNRKSNKIMRRHTTEYRGPSHFTMPHMVHDSSDSVNKSPAVKKNSVKNYPYLMLTESRFSQKKSSLTSTTSEDNSDAMISTLKTRSQSKEWRDNKIPRKIDSQTVDRKLYRKNSSKSAKIKRRGSLNIIDPTANKTQFNKENHNAKSPLLDPKKVSLQISAEDMVQIANCGARNKNGSLCHFISTNNDNYLSISQALINQSSSSEDVLTNKSLPSKHSIDKKSSHSLVLNLSDDCLNIEEPKNNVSLKSVEMDNIGIHNKTDSLAKRHKGHSRQHSHDIDRTYRKEEYIAIKKLVHTKSEGQRSYKVPNYFPENGASLKQHTSLDKRSNVLDNAECRCLVSNHTLAMMDGKKHDLNNEVNYGSVAYHHFGTSSREELTNSQDIEDTFDF